MPAVVCETEMVQVGGLGQQVGTQDEREGEGDVNRTDDRIMVFA